jgi:quercetin dioxygenase-like cupin family protein
MPHYRACGSIPPKRHTQHRDPDGSLYYEELIGEEGFSSDSSLLYHRFLPSTVSQVSAWQPGDLATTPNHPLRPLHLLLHELFDPNNAGSVDVVTGRRLVLGNDDVRISYVVAAATSPLYRNAVGDECIYLESGDATIETVFGTLTARAGDYVLIPRGTTHRWIPTGPDPLRGYCIEANSHIAPAARYLSKFGQLLEHAPFCERDLPWGLDILLEVRLNGEVIATPPFSQMYWTAAQQLAHMTVNGARLRVGDFYASGTVGGPARHQRGSLLELSWGGSDPIAMADGTERSFLLDGDHVTIGAMAPAIGGGHLDMGAVTGTVNPAVISVYQQLDQ